MSRKRLDDDDFLVDAESVKHAQQVFPAARHLSLHGQTEIFLHSFGDSTGHRVVSEKIKGFVFFVFLKKKNANIHMIRNVFFMR